MRPATAIALSALLGTSTTNALALDTKRDCLVLKQIVDDAKNSFKNVRSDDQPLEMDTAKTFDASVTFSDSQWCKVVVSFKFFNENYSCDLRNTTMEATESFIKQCMGEAKARGRDVCQRPWGSPGPLENRIVFPVQSRSPCRVAKQRR